MTGWEEEEGRRTSEAWFGGVLVLVGPGFAVFFISIPFLHLWYSVVVYSLLRQILPTTNTHQNISIATHIQYIKEGKGKEHT